MSLTADLYGELNSVRRYPGLENTEGVVRLLRRGTAPPDDPSFVPLIVVDEVSYGSSAPWPDSPGAGQGDALARIDPTNFANFPVSWVGRAASPGVVDFFPRSMGDANDDGLLNQQDLTQVYRSGKYMSGQPATWAEGDWNGDGVFNQKDIVAALQTGTYLQAPNAAKWDPGSLVKPSLPYRDVADSLFAELGNTAGRPSGPDE
jgi:hypothetical protein